jgi:hypothetical protein
VGVYSRSRGGSGDIRVKAFARLGEGRMSPTLSAELAHLRQEQGLPREAWVTIWGLRSDPGEIARQIQPIVDAGFHVRGVSTPAMALTAVARRREHTTPGTVAAYVALETGAMCLAVVRGGVLLFSRETPLEFGVSAESVGDRLVDELRRSFVFFRQSFPAAVERIVLCGGMPNLRSLTSSTGSTLKLPVETLDSLSGIDAEAVPEPADTFRATVAALWPALAIASQGHDQPNLLPAASRPKFETRTRLARVAAVVIVGALIVATWHFLARPRSDRAPELVRQETPVVLPRQEAAPELARRDDARDTPRAVNAEPELVVDTILFSAERRLAIVNGRIVQVGDRVGASATILDIEPQAVIVQSADGTKRTLGLRRR